MKTLSQSLDVIRVRRLLAVSDLHVDYARNRQWVEGLREREYSDAALLVAGDVSHRLELVEWTLGVLTNTFAAVFFVPGNHDLWTTEDSLDSLEKMRRLEAICASLGVRTDSALLESGSSRVQVVPLVSWYHEPEESGDSLFVGSEGHDPWRDAWADYRRITWPGRVDPGGAAEYLARANRKWPRHHPEIPVVTFSHFLPRRELLRGGSPARIPVRSEPRHAFNFSRVAGSFSIDRQLREFAATTHVYGHQHRNRDRMIEGVRYVSHCLGYPSERDKCHITGLEEGPIEVWTGNE